MSLVAVDQSLALSASVIAERQEAFQRPAPNRFTIPSGSLLLAIAAVFIVSFVVHVPLRLQQVGLLRSTADNTAENVMTVQLPHLADLADALSRQITLAKMENASVDAGNATTWELFGYSSAAELMNASRTSSSIRCTESTCTVPDDEVARLFIEQAASVVWDRWWRSALLATLRAFQTTQSRLEAFSHLRFVRRADGICSGVFLRDPRGTMPAGGYVTYRGNCSSCASLVFSNVSSSPLSWTADASLLVRVLVPTATATVNASQSTALKTSWEFGSTCFESQTISYSHTVEIPETNASPNARVLGAVAASLSLSNCSQIVKLTAPDISSALVSTGAGVAIALRRAPEAVTGRAPINTTTNSSLRCNQGYCNVSSLALLWPDMHAAIDASVPLLRRAAEAAAPGSEPVVVVVPSVNGNVVVASPVLSGPFHDDSVFAIALQPATAMRGDLDSTVNLQRNKLLLVVAVLIAVVVVPVWYVMHGIDSARQTLEDACWNELNTTLAERVRRMAESDGAIDAVKSGNPLSGEERTSSGGAMAATTTATTAASTPSRRKSGGPRTSSQGDRNAQEAPTALAGSNSFAAASIVTTTTTTNLRRSSSSMQTSGESTTRRDSRKEWCPFRERTMLLRSADHVTLLTNQALARTPLAAIKALHRAGQARGAALRAASIRDGASRISSCMDGVFVTIGSCCDGNAVVPAERSIHEALTLATMSTTQSMLGGSTSERKELTQRGERGTTVDDSVSTRAESFSTDSVGGIGSSFPLPHSSPLPDASFIIFDVGPSALDDADTLHEYIKLMRAVTTLIINHGGVVERVESSFIIASFNAHVECVAHRATALSCALALHRYMERQLGLWSLEDSFNLKQFGLDYALSIDSAPLSLLRAFAVGEAQHLRVASWIAKRLRKEVKQSPPCTFRQVVVDSDAIRRLMAVVSLMRLRRVSCVATSHIRTASDANFQGVALDLVEFFPMQSTLLYDLGKPDEMDQSAANEESATTTAVLNFMKDRDYEEALRALKRCFIISRNIERLTHIVEQQMTRPPAERAEYCPRYRPQRAWKSDAEQEEEELQRVEHPVEFESRDAAIEASRLADTFL